MGPRTTRATLLTGRTLRALAFSTLVTSGTLGTLGTVGTLDPFAHAQARERIAYVSVIDEKTKAPLRDVTPDMIAIREDGTRREVLKVGPATAPMPIAVLVDNSQAAAPTISDLRKALTSFMTTVEGVGPVALFTIAARPTVLQQYSPTTKALLDAVNRLFHQPDTGATLLDAISEVSRGLAKRDAERAAIVIVAGENVEHSNLFYGQVLDELRASGAMMYAILLVNSKNSVSTEAERNRATVLDRGVRESGGMRIDVLTSMSFEPQLKVFAAMLKSQQRVVYSRPESLIPPERVQISSGKPGIEVYGAPARTQGTK